VYLAHELCHALFDPCTGAVHVVVDRVVDRKALQAEQRARAFAAELLLPLQGVRPMIDAALAIREPYAALELIGRVRSRFGTPHAIAANHLCNQNLISADMREWLEARSSTFAAEPPATTLPAVHAPSLLVEQLTKRAHDEGLITDGEARGLLALDNLAPLPWETEL
jgi:Zn-dependent peptidase ImmA (M78 family)